MMVYRELGVVPLDVDIKFRMLTYWAKLCLWDKHKTSNTIYSLLYTLDEKNIWMDTNCKINTELLCVFWILVKTNTSMLYWSIQTVIQAETKGSVYTKIAGINISRRKIY